MSFPTASVTSPSSFRASSHPSIPPKPPLINRQHFLLPPLRRSRSNLPLLLPLKPYLSLNDPASAPVSPARHSKHSSLADTDAACSQIRRRSGGHLCDHSCIPSRTPGHGLEGGGRKEEEEAITKGKIHEGDGNRRRTGGAD